MNWITFRTLHPHDPELDTDVSVNPDNIVCIIGATNKDRQQRKEMQSIVVVAGGGTYGSDSTSENIQEKIRNARL